MPFCSISQTQSCLHIFVNEYHSFDIGSLRKLICISNLGINIDNASEDEWVQTAYTDRHDFSTVYRLRNPNTNTRFTKEELTKIYRFVSYSDENIIHNTRNSVKN